jgi:hypothetical protein
VEREWGEGVGRGGGQHRQDVGLGELQGQGDGVQGRCRRG